MVTSKLTSKLRYAIHNTRNKSLVHQSDQLVSQKMVRAATFLHLFLLFKIVYGYCKHTHQTISMFQLQEKKNNNKKKPLKKNNPLLPRLVLNTNAKTITKC